MNMADGPPENKRVGIPSQGTRPANNSTGSKHSAALVAEASRSKAWVAAQARTKHPENPSMRELDALTWIAAQALNLLKGFHSEPEKAAFFAYEIAAAMLSERKRRKGLI